MLSMWGYKVQSMLYAHEVYFCIYSVLIYSYTFTLFVHTILVRNNSTIAFPEIALLQEMKWAIFVKWLTTMNNNPWPREDR